MAFIDGTVVNVALPVMQSDLEATATQAQWVFEAYLLFLSSLILLGGSLGDRLGRRRVFASGIVIFTLASAWCGLAPNVGQLITARAVQGAGAALLVPGSLALLSASFSTEQRGRAIGTWSGSTALATALGPVLGGWLAEQASWRAVFFINLPIAATALAILLLRVPESRAESTSAALDGWGALLAALGLGGLVFGLLESSKRGWSDPLVAGPLAAGLAAIVAFLIVEARSRHAMVPFSLFRPRPFSATNLLTLLLYAALTGATFFLPFNLIQVQAYSPAAAGAAFLPFIVALSALSRWSGGLVSRYGPKRPLIIGPAIAALGFLLFALPGIGGSYWTTFFPPFTVLGVGMAVTVPPLTATVMGSVARRHAGLASGINNAVARTAGLLAVALFGIVALSVFNGSLDRRLASLRVSPAVRQALDAERIKLAAAEPPSGISQANRQEIEQAIAASFVRSFRAIMLIAAALALASAVSAALMLRRPRPARGP